MARKGFFSLLKNKMKQDFGGRYVAHVIAECLFQNPEIAKSIWGILPSKFSIETEWGFGSRRSDLALINQENGEALALLEIKYEDHGDEKNNEQLRDYIKYCNENRIPFVYLTKFPPPARDYSLIKERYLSYSELRKRLILADADSPVIDMLIEFLGEESFMYNEITNEDALQLLMLRAVKSSHRHGFGRLNTYSRMTNDVPDIFNTVINNSAALGSMLYEKISFRDLDGCPEIRIKRPVTNFRFTPYFNAAKLKKYLSDLNMGDGEPVYLKIDAEATEFWSASHICLSSSPPYLYLHIGVMYYLDTESKKLSTRIYSEIESDREFTYSDKEVELGVTENNAYKYGIDVVVDAISDAVLGKDKINDEHRNILSRVSDLLTK